MILQLILMDSKHLSMNFEKKYSPFETNCHEKWYRHSDPNEL